MRRRALLAAIPPTISASVAGCVGDASSNGVSRTMEGYESDTEGQDFEQTSRRHSFCDDEFVVIEQGLCSEDEQRLTGTEASDGHRGSLLGFVLTSRADADALQTENLDESERELLDGVNYVDESLIILQGSYPQSTATLEVQYVGVATDRTYVGTQSVMQDDDEPDLVSTFVLVEHSDLSGTLVVGNELIANGDEPLGHAIFE